MVAGATTQGQNGPGSDGNEGALHTPQSSSITGASPSVYLVSYLGHSLGKSNPSANMWSVYSTAWLQTRQPKALRNIVYSFITIILRSILTLSGSTW